MVDLAGRLPADPAVQACAVVAPSIAVQLLTEVRERTEPNATHELLGQRSVEPLQLPSSLGVVGAPVDHADAPLIAVAPELLRDEAASIVDVDRLGLPAALECPPEGVDRLASSFPPVGPGHDQVSRAIVQDGDDVDLPDDARDAERVGVHLPEGIDEAPLKPLERGGFLDDPDHEPVSLQDAMDRPPADLNASPGEDGVDPHRTPGGMPSSQLEDPIGQIPVDAVWAVVRTARVVPKAFNTMLSIVSAPIPQRALGDPEDLADVRGPDPSLQVLFDGLQTEANIFLDHDHPFPGAATCPGNSGGKMSCHTTPRFGSASRKFPSFSGATWDAANT